MDRRRLIKSTKFSNDVVVIGPEVKTIKRKGETPLEQPIPRSDSGKKEVIVGVSGVVKPAGASEASDFSGELKVLEASPTDLMRISPEQARTIRTEKMLEEKMAKAEQIMEEAESKMQLAEQKLEEALTKIKQLEEESAEKNKAMIEETRRYCQQLEESAKRDGFEVGKKIGLEEGKKEIQEIVQKAMQMLSEVINLRETVYKQLEPQIAKLAIKIAEQIIKSEVTLNYDIVINLIRSALDKVKDREEVVIKVNPSDLENVRSQEDFFRKLMTGVKHFEIVGDSTVEKGSCFIDTNLGNLDARISTQLEAIKIAFEEAEKAE